jgi:hypothetical protein
VSEASLTIREVHSHHCVVCESDWEHEGPCGEGPFAWCPWCFPAPQAPAMPGQRTGPHKHFCPECRRTWNHPQPCAAALRVVIPDCPGCHDLTRRRHVWRWGWPFGARSENVGKATATWPGPRWKCAVCGGRGRLAPDEQLNRGLERCPACHGTGRRWRVWGRLVTLGAIAGGLLLAGVVALQPVRGPAGGDRRRPAARPPTSVSFSPDRPAPDPSPTQDPSARLVAAPQPSGPTEPVDERTPPASRREGASTGGAGAPSGHGSTPAAAGPDAPGDAADRPRTRAAVPPGSSRRDAAPREPSAQFCPRPPEPAIVLEAGSGRLLGSFVRVVREASRCLYMFRRYDGSLGTIDATRARAESSGRSFASPGYVSER